MREAFWGKILDLIKQKKNLMLSGLAGSAKTYLLAEIFKAQQSKILCILPSEEKAFDFHTELKSYFGENKVFLFPSRDPIFFQENLAYATVQRLMALQDLLYHPAKPSIIISSAAAFLYPIMTPDKMKEKQIVLQEGQELILKELLANLIRNAYQRTDTITKPGEFALRGGVLDIFPIEEKYPYRLDLFGDLIESIKRFDPDTQRSDKKVSKIKVNIADEMMAKEIKSTLFTYLPQNTQIFFDESSQFYKVLERQHKRSEEIIKEMKQEKKAKISYELIKKADLEEEIKQKTTIYHSFFPASQSPTNIDYYEHISQQEMERFYHNPERMYQRLKDWLERGYQVQISLSNKKIIEEIKKELSEKDIRGIEFNNQEISQGFISQTMQVAVLGERDIFKKKTTKKASSSQIETKLLLEDLKTGDYLVHESHGIGIFRGVTQAITDGVTREYILVQYGGSDKLYIPLDKLHLLHKYSSSDDKEPRLSKLGGAEWEKTRKRVAESIEKMAGELLVLYAKREALEGYAFSSDTPWQTQFEDDFPYQETKDQLKAIADVKKDMEKPKPMDRLICGDVGYGKTEVAMRATFKAVMDAKQVAILVPTTVLAEQHYRTFRERFKEYPTNIEVLSRFCSAGQQKRILEDLKNGSVDIIIGTHRLLSRDIQFADLGLLVIDEEHRFGVKQKEKIKALRELLDVLSLSATPIPRSLHMSLTGMRDLSIIETPPANRYPITTYVLEYNEEIIREAVLSEIERGGQVFFVHNRIQDIYKVLRKLEELLGADVRITIGHGRMNEEELSKNMMAFINGQYEVLLCTTIIESGLDMPRVNTIIVDDADKMGLAQLYQLRGRVGRSNSLAYAYLTYQPEKSIQESAQKRLNAIRDFGELGSGMKIALRDLEIRGAGNILGAEQHGYIHAIGFDLYCRLLEEETAKMKGVPHKEFTLPQVEIDMDYYIPDSYIPDSGTKIRIYRKLLLSNDVSEIEEIQAELIDRFGEMPLPVKHFMQISILRLIAKNKNITAIRKKGKNIEIQIDNTVLANSKLRINKDYKRINSNTISIELLAKQSLMHISEILESL